MWIIGRILSSRLWLDYATIIRKPNYDMDFDNISYLTLGNPKHNFIAIIHWITCSKIKIVPKCWYTNHLSLALKLPKWGRQFDLGNMVVGRHKNISVKKIKIFL